MLDHLRSTKLATRIIAFMVVVLVATVALNYAVVIPRHREASEAGMLAQAASFTAIAEETKDYMAGLTESQVIAVQQLKEELEHDLGGLPFA